MDVPLLRVVNRPPLCHRTPFSIGGFFMGGYVKRGNWKEKLDHSVGYVGKDKLIQLYESRKNTPRVQHRKRSGKPLPKGDPGSDKSKRRRMPIIFYDDLGPESCAQYSDLNVNLMILALKVVPKIRVIM